MTPDEVVTKLNKLGETLDAHAERLLELKHLRASNHRLIGLVTVHNLTGDLFVSKVEMIGTKLDELGLVMEQLMVMLHKHAEENGYEHATPPRRPKSLAATPPEPGRGR
jgi:hypothetical protein